jgi:hypothetical protein
MKGPNPQRQVLCVKVNLEIKIKAIKSKEGRLFREKGLMMRAMSPLVRPASHQDLHL